MATTEKTTVKAKSIYHTGIGRRKTAAAQVRLTPGKGKFIINGEEISEPNKGTLQPLIITGQLGKYDVSVVVRGGGMTGQVDAIRLGIARALVDIDESLRSTLRKSSFLTRDPREKERKKPGLKRARKAPQWQKR